MEERRPNLMPVVLAVVLALPMAYVGGYYASVMPCQTIGLEGDRMMISYTPAYRGVEQHGHALFYPIHRLDRRVRPKTWGATELFNFDRAEAR